MLTSRYFRKQEPKRYSQTLFVWVPLVSMVVVVVATVAAPDLLISGQTSVGMPSFLSQRQSWGTGGCF